jgi:NitT/TauT family transport system substrate-binding protein
MLLSVAALAFPGPIAAQELVSIKMAGVPEDSATPVLYGISSGLFRRHGLAVEMQVQHNGPSIMSGVIGNSYQIGKSSTPPLIAAFSKGLPFAILAPAGLSSESAPIAALLVKADAAIHKASDLIGKTIAVGALNDVHSLAVRCWMDKSGVDSASVRFAEIPISEIPVAIDQGRVDAGSVNEPVLSAALAGGKDRILARHFDAIAPRFAYTAWFTTTHYVAANPAVVKTFTQALREAARYCNSHHTATIDLIADYTSLLPSQVQKMTRVEQGTSLDPTLIQPVIDAMAKFKFVPQRFDARELIAPALA